MTPTPGFVRTLNHHRHSTVDTRVSTCQFFSKLIVDRMFLTRSEYDRSVNTFSPEGRLFQVSRIACLGSVPLITFA